MMNIEIQCNKVLCPKIGTPTVNTPMTCAHPFYSNYAHVFKNCYITNNIAHLLGYNVTLGREEF